MEDYILHYGVLGMKWGIRRYQNEDGTLTEAGKKRIMHQDKKFSKNHPDKAKKAEQLRSYVMKNFNESIRLNKQFLKKDSENKLQKTFDEYLKDARTEINAEKDYLKETWEYSGITKRPTEKDALESLYASIGENLPIDASAKSWAKILQSEDAIILRNGTYDKLIADSKKNIDNAEKILDAIGNLSLKEIYKNGTNMYYRYWKSHGYID